MLLFFFLSPCLLLFHNITAYLEIAVVALNATSFILFGNTLFTQSFPIQLRRHSLDVEQSQLPFRCSRACSLLPFSLLLEESLAEFVLLHEEVVWVFDREEFGCFLNNMLILRIRLYLFNRRRNWRPASEYVLSYLLAFSCFLLLCFLLLLFLFFFQTLHEFHRHGISWLVLGHSNFDHAGRLLN